MELVDNELIEKIKRETTLCDTFCCYEDCERCVAKYLAYLERKKRDKVQKELHELRDALLLYMSNEVDTDVVQDDWDRAEFGFSHGAVASAIEDFFDKYERKMNEKEV